MTRFKGQHVSDEALILHAIAEAVEPDDAEHIKTCQHCRNRSFTLMGAITTARRDPDQLAYIRLHLGQETTEAALGAIDRAMKHFR